MKRICPQGPYFLGGHSFGGLVVFEMAQQLRKAGEEVGLLVLIDPTTRRTANQQLSSPASDSNSQKQCSSERFGSHVLRHLRHLQESPRGSRAGYFKQCLFRMLIGMIVTPLSKKGKRLTCRTCWRLGWMPPVLRTSFIREVLYSDVYREASKAYRPEQYDGRAVLILAEYEGRLDPKAIWTALIPNGLTNFAVPGNHSGILQVPHVGVLAGHLRNCLNEAQQSVLVTKSARSASTRDNIIQFETARAFARH